MGKAESADWTTEQMLELGTKAPPFALPDAGGFVHSMPDEAADREAVERIVRDVLAGLPDREEALLKMRFGIDSGDEYTLERIGGQLGLSRERVRQLQSLAVKKLKKSSNLADLAAIFEKVESPETTRD